MRYLQDYIDRTNGWNSLFKGVTYSLDNPADFQAILDMIESDLSPENLTCDGELRGAALHVKARQLNGAKAEIEDLIKQHGVSLNA